MEDKGRKVDAQESRYAQYEQEKIQEHQDVGDLKLSLVDSFLFLSIATYRTAGTSEGGPS